MYTRNYVQEGGGIQLGKVEKRERDRETGAPGVIKSQEVVP
jgi:hypothetical protein